MIEALGNKKVAPVNPHLNCHFPLSGDLREYLSHQTFTFT